MADLTLETRGISRPWLGQSMFSVFGSTWDLAATWPKCGLFLFGRGLCGSNEGGESGEAPHLENLHHF